MSLYFIKCPSVENKKNPGEKITNAFTVGNNRAFSIMCIAFGLDKKKLTISDLNGLTIIIHVEILKI